MGLDMYMKRCNRTHHTPQQLVEIDNEYTAPDAEELKPFRPLHKYEYLDDVYSIFHEVAYWRKFNALHNWFVENIQNGVDDCGTYEISRSSLDRLMADIEKTIEGEVTDLEPVAGFFFGSTEKDDYYWEVMERAKVKIKSIQETFDFGQYRLFYYSSW
jgi:hypothetical protein